MKYISVKEVKTKSIECVSASGMALNSHGSQIMKELIRQIEIYIYIYMYI